MKKRFLALVLMFAMLLSLLPMTVNAAGVIQTGANILGWNWYDVNMNGMGWTTGVVASADGTIYAKTDVGGVYRLQRGVGLNGRPDSWLPLNDEMGGNLSQYMSIESIAVHPTNGQIVYFAGGNGYGEIFKSTNGGDKWESTGFRSTNTHMEGNGNGRASTGERLRFDPNNPNFVYFASRNNGLWRYDALNNNWTKVAASGLPDTTGLRFNLGNGNYEITLGYTYVAFDPDPTAPKMPDGSSSRFYVGVHGVRNGTSSDNATYATGAQTGIFVTNDGGATFTRLGGTQTNRPQGGVVNNSGVFVSTAGDGIYTSTKGGNLARVGTVAAWTYGLSVDSSNQFVAIGSGNGADAYRISAAGTLLWSRSMQNRDLIPYATFNGWCHPERGGFVIDPLDTTRGFAGTGFGIVKLVDIGPSHTGTIHCDDYTQGISELCAMYFKIPPNDADVDLIFGTMDLGHIVVEDRTQVPTVRTMLGNSQFTHGEWNVPLTIGTGFDFCWSYPNYMAYTGSHMFGNHALKYGVSRDGGRTWEEIHISDSMKAARGIDNIASTSGVLAMSSSNPYNLVWSPDYGGFMKWSDDMGSTWNDPVNLDELTAGGVDGDRFYERAMYYWGDAQTLQADRVRGDTFYLYTAKGNIAEFWRTTDAGKNWTKQYTFAGEVGVPWAKVHVNPIVEGDVFITLGTINGNTRPLYRSADKDCTSFTQITNVQYVNALGFGAGDTKEVPWIYIYGRANNDTIDGIYVSKNNCVSWEKITCDDTEQYYGVTCIGGDMRTRGLIYVSRGGRGIAVGELATGVESVNFYDDQWNNGKHPKDTSDKLLIAPEFKLGEEIIENGYFAAGTDQWDTYDHSELSLTQTGGTYGDRYMTVGVRGGSYDRLYQTLDPNKLTMGLHTISAWVYLDGSNSLKVGLHFMGEAPDLYLPVVTKTGEWVKVEGVVEITAAHLAAREQQFVVDTTNADNLYRVASVSVKSGGSSDTKPTRPQDEELLLNGDFSGESAHWGTYFWAATLNVVNTPGVHDGKAFDRYLNVTGRGATYDNLAQSKHDNPVFQVQRYCPVLNINSAGYCILRLLARCSA
jgi:hypothetical protein